MFTVRATDSQKPVGKDSALKKGFELFGDMFGKVFALGLGHRLKCTKVPRNHLVERRSLGAAGLILTLSQSAEAELLAGVVVAHGTAVLQGTCQAAIPASCAKTRAFCPPRAFRFAILTAERVRILDSSNASLRASRERWSFQYRP